MAQQVERVLGKDEVTGSNPVSSSKSKIRAHLAPLFLAPVNYTFKCNTLRTKKEVHMNLLYN